MFPKFENFPKIWSKLTILVSRKAFPYIFFCISVMAILFGGSILQAQNFSEKIKVLEFWSYQFQNSEKCALWEKSKFPLSKLWAYHGGGDVSQKNVFLETFYLGSKNCYYFILRTQMIIKSLHVLFFSKIGRGKFRFFPQSTFFNILKLVISKFPKFCFL